MADRKSYQEKTKPAILVLYAVAVLALLVMLVFLYRNWTKQRRQYNTLVQEAAATEADYDIENRKPQSLEAPEN